MKEIGEKLKETRESIGISIDEVAEDLKMLPSNIEDIEAGNREPFKDIFSLKYLIRDYSKYLGLNYEDMVDDFNEYLFDYTSQISLDDIKKAKKEDRKDDKVRSPYTTFYKYPQAISKYVILGLLTLLLILIIYLIYDTDKDNDETLVVSITN